MYSVGIKNKVCFTTVTILYHKTQLLAIHKLHKVILLLLAMFVSFINCVIACNVLQYTCNQEVTAVSNSPFKVGQKGGALMEYITILIITLLLITAIKK